MRIFIVGYMGSGKSRYGRRLAQTMNLPFYDLDRYIEEREGATISQLFVGGESYFREAEKTALHYLCENEEDFILSTGGGTPCFSDNMAYMKSQGETYFLDTPIETLVERLRKSRLGRPLLARLSEAELEPFIRVHYAQRLAFYQMAEHVIPQE